MKVQLLELQTSVDMKQRLERIVTYQNYKTFVSIDLCEYTGLISEANHYQGMKKNSSQ